jgi:hypothetical protein
MSQRLSAKSTGVFDGAAVRGAQWLNLILPGGGMICSGDIAGGLTIGLVFAAAATLAVTGSLIIPDDFSPKARNLAIVAGALAYVAAQFLFAQGVRSRVRRGVADLRRGQLGEATRQLRSGDRDLAWAALQPLAAGVDNDLLLALRWAQAVEMRGDRTEAVAAWARVRRLDAHHLYRREIRAAEARLAETGSAASAEPPRAG